MKKRDGIPIRLSVRVYGADSDLLYRLETVCIRSAPCQWIHAMESS